jgi:hypothetical protein
MLADANDGSSDDRRAGKPLPPWRADAETDNGTVTAPEPARSLPIIPKSLSTLATELRELVFRDRKSRARHDR